MGQQAFKLHPLDCDNFLDKVLQFRDRNAGVSVIYDPDEDCHSYNAYVVETSLMKELWSQEFENVEEALDKINSEYGTWDLKSLIEESGCQSCVAH